MDASRSSVQGYGTSPELEPGGAHEVSTGAILDPVHNTMYERLIRSIQMTLACTTRQSMLQVAEQPDLADTILENSLRVSVRKELG